MEQVDTIVVGAGPAGSATALLLARAGYDVLLLDRHEFPRAKPCGDCLSAGATRILHYLGVMPRLEAESPAHLQGWRIFSPGGHELYRAFDGLAPEDPLARTALALPRHRLDTILLDAARREGAEVRTGLHVTDLLRDPIGNITGVRARTADNEYRLIQARLVIGADGLRSTIARRLGLMRRLPRLRKISLTAHLHGVRDLDNTGELHLIDGACIGLAPVHAPGPEDEAPLCNLTLVADGDRFARQIASEGTSTFFWKLVRCIPKLRERIPYPQNHDDAGTPLEPATGRLLASGPFDSPTRTVALPGAALVGDAAGYYDPFTGQGIFQGLTSALILAEEAAFALGAGSRHIPHLKHYARRREHALRGPRLVQHLIETIISRPHLADFAIDRLARSPTTTATLIAITGDLRPARSLLSPRVALDLVQSIARAKNG